jgi:hypothetical protein
MTSVFGVRANSIEQALPWVREAIGLSPEPRESLQLGGNYYAFRTADGAVLKLISNRDQQDGEPIVEACDDWPIVLLLDGVSDASPLRGKLTADAAHFQKL